MNYIDNPDADIRIIEDVYDKLFTNYRFSANADVNVYAKYRPIEDSDKSNITSLHLTKPTIDTATYIDKDGLKVYLSVGQNLAVNEDVVAFLNSKGFYDSEEEGIEVVPHIINVLNLREDSYLDVLLQSLSSKKPTAFEAFIKSLLVSIISDDLTQPTTEELNLAQTLTGLYIDEFYVSFTARSFVANGKDKKSTKAGTDTLTNYEAREYIGDRASWSVMTAYFMERFGRDQTLNERHLTALHRDYCSKQVQASIASSLFFHDWIRINGRIDVNVFEDVFEAFIGTLYEVSFRESFRGERDVKPLHDVFLRKLYDSFDFTAEENKPAFTELNENLIALQVVISSVLRKTSNRIFARLNDEQKANLALSMSEEQMMSFTSLLGRGRRYDKLTMLTEQEAFYREANNFLCRAVGNNVLEDLKNAKYADESQLKALKIALEGRHFRVRLENVEKNWTDTFWTLTVLDADGKQLAQYSTKDYDYPDIFESLLALIDQKTSKSTPKHDAKEDILIPYVEGEAFVVRDGQRFSFNPKITTKTVKATGLRMQLSLFGETVDYDDEVHLEFGESFRRFCDCLPANTDASNICILLGQDLPKTNDHSVEVLAFVGNRLLLTYGNRILYARTPDANERDLTNMQTFYFSKIVKRELARLLKVSVDFDVLIGLLGEKAGEALINLIFLNMTMKESDCFEYGKEANLICERLERKPIDKAPAKDAKGAKDAKVKKVFQKPKTYFTQTKEGYAFAYKDLHASITYRHKNYAVARRLLEKKAYETLIKAYGAFEMSNLMNDRFMSHPGYPKLTNLFRQRNQMDFRLSFVDHRGRKRIRVRIGLDLIFIFDDLEETFTYLERTLQ